MAAKRCTLLLVAVLLAFAALANAELWPGAAESDSQNLWVVQDASYRPRLVNWEELLSQCRALTQSREIATSLIKASFQPMLMVDTNKCKVMTAEKSLPFPAEELKANLLGADASTIASTAVFQLSAYFGTSVADALAVCSSVAIESLTNNRVDLVTTKPFVVGRLDIQTFYSPISAEIVEAAADELLVRLDNKEVKTEDVASHIHTMLYAYAEMPNPYKVTQPCATAHPKRVIAIGHSRKLKQVVVGLPPRLPPPSPVARVEPPVLTGGTIIPRLPVATSPKTSAPVATINLTVRFAVVGVTHSANGKAVPLTVSKGDTVAAVCAKAISTLQARTGVTLAYRNLILQTAAGQALTPSTTKIGSFSTVTSGSVLTLKVMV